MTDKRNTMQVYKIELELSILMAIHICRKNKEMLILKKRAYFIYDPNNVVKCIRVNLR